MLYTHTQLIFHCRTVTNVKKKLTTITASDGNNKENQPSTSGVGDGGAGAGAGAAVQQEKDAEAEEAHNADNYDARQARKRTKKKEQVDAFQERLLKAIEPQAQVDVPAPAPPPKREYVDVALEAMSFKMKEVLSKEEIIDLVEDLENLVSRACREKRRRMELVATPNVPPQHPLQEPIYAGPPGPQGPMAVAVPFNNNTTGNNEPTFYNFN